MTGLRQVKPGARAFSHLSGPGTPAVAEWTAEENPRNTRSPSLHPNLTAVSPTTSKEMLELESYGHLWAGKEVRSPALPWLGAANPSYQQGPPRVGAHPPPPWSPLCSLLCPGAHLACPSSLLALGCWDFFIGVPELREIQGLQGGSKLTTQISPFHIQQPLPPSWPLPSGHWIPQRLEGTGPHVDSQGRLSGPKHTHLGHRAGPQAVQRWCLSTRR